MSTVLRSKKQGVANGDSLLVLHGWGMNISVWDTVKESLEGQFQVIWLDLPGHGDNHEVHAQNLAEIVDHILPLIKHPMHIMGWSLGGLIAQEVMRQRPELVKRVVMVASTPRFSDSCNWKNAMSREVLEAFSDNLLKDIQGTIKRFIALQFMGVKGSQAIQRELRDNLLKNLPDEAALMLGLDILKYQDFRKLTTDHQQLWVLGEKDRLVPVKIESDLRRLFPAASLKIISDAGHAPFMTHPEQFENTVIEFLTAK